MAVDTVTNFAYSTIATAPSPEASGTTFVVESGDGALFPSGTFDTVLWPSGVNPTLANAEIVRGTVSGDNFTVTRGEYGTTKQSVAAGWQVSQSWTANLLAQIIAEITAATPVNVVRNTSSLNATAGAGETTILTGSTASKTLTLPSAPSTAVPNVVKNASSVSVTIAAGGSDAISFNGTTGSITLLAGQKATFVYLSGTWYVDYRPVYSGQNASLITLTGTSATLLTTVSIPVGTWRALVGGTVGGVSGKSTVPEFGFAAGTASAAFQPTAPGAIGWMSGAFATPLDMFIEVSVSAAGTLLVTGLDNVNNSPTIGVGNLSYSIAPL